MEQEVCLPRASRQFMAIDAVGRSYAVTEFIHLRPAAGVAAPVPVRSWRLDNGEWVNACTDDGTLICMRTGMLLRRRPVAASWAKTRPARTAPAAASTATPSTVPFPAACSN